MNMKQLVARVVLTLIFVGVGIGHFTADARFLANMPPYIPAPLWLVWVSGVFEILGGLGIWAPWPRVRRLAGYGLVALLVSVYIVNIDMAFHGSPLRDGTVVPFGSLLLWLRLPLQFVFMWLAVYATRPSDVPPRLSPVDSAYAEPT